jgi:DNA (cytosine-5)-methyltransferase 1
MHAHGPRGGRVPQSRNRFYLAYCHQSIPAPDWNKWLRPKAYCPTCDTVVSALLVFKKPGEVMGAYGRNGQYYYRCPSTRCRGRIVEPATLPAAAAIDWSLPGQRIADRTNPLAPATMDRIRAGLTKFGRPPAVPPLLVPTEGRPGKTATPATEPLRTQTARNETGIAFPPFQVSLRGGGSKNTALPLTDPLGTVTASGNHHGLITPELPAMVMRNNSSKGPATEPLRTLTTAGHQSLVTWDSILVPYYTNGAARPVHEPVGTVTTVDRWSLAEAADAIDLGDVRFRMLEPHEIGRAMAFPDDYIVFGSKRDRVRQYGNAVTPPVMEIIVSALVEAITGEPLEPATTPSTQHRAS